MSKWKIILGLIIVVLAILFFTRSKDTGTPAVSGTSTSGSTSSGSHYFEITIDGKTHRISQEDQGDDQILIAGVAANRNLLISASDKKEDYMFNLVLGGDSVTPGTYEVYACYQDSSCDSSDYHRSSVDLQPYTSALTDITTFKSSYKYPPLSLSPVTLTISSVNDTLWEGVGPAKEIKGTFKGTLAHVEKDTDGPGHIVGTPSTIEGSFDIYAAAK